MKDNICDDIVDSINKCINNNEFHNYKYYKEFEHNYFTKKDLLECSNYIELNKTLLKINMNIDLKDNINIQMQQKFAYNIFYNKYTQHISICL